MTIAFRKDLEAVINRHSMENGSNTPDFILATYLINCLENFDAATKCRESWYNIPISNEEVAKVPDVV